MQNSPLSSVFPNRIFSYCHKEMFDKALDRLLGLIESQVEREILLEDLEPKVFPKGSSHFLSDLFS